jgi:hypothetical protein
MRTKEIYTDDNTADIDNISCERKKFIQKQHYRYRQYFIRTNEVYTGDNTADIDNISYELKFIQETTLQIQTIFHTNEKSLYRRQHYRYREYLM